MLDGGALASEIRSQDLDLPVILTTGYGKAARTSPSDFRVVPLFRRRRKQTWRTRNEAAGFESTSRFGIKT
jgi:hypothetical protein